MAAKDNALYARSPARREGIRNWMRATAKRSKEAVLNYLLSHPCVDCGEADPIVLEFDHRDPKTKLFGISKGQVNGLASGKLFAEIAKCDVRCANCHRRKTYQERGLGHRTPLPLTIGAGEA